LIKLVVLNLDGDFEQGFRVNLEISDKGKYPYAEMTGFLPPFALLVSHYHNWRSTYRSLGSNLRAIRVKKVAIGGSLQTQSEELSSNLNQWLSSEGFYPLREKWLEKVGTDCELQVIIRTSDFEIRQLPWHQWDFIERYPNCEIALSSPEYEEPALINKQASRKKIKILAILGNSEGINIEKDRQVLENLPHATTTFLVEPGRQKLNNKLWEQSWDILFFAGHSRTEGESGRIYINQNESLTIDELREGLRAAINKGLQIAIFNSCDGLGLANELEQLHIPQVIVMREPIPDEVAQQFLKDFLKAFAGGKSLYLAVQEARRKLQGLEDKLPCASWLPVICQNSAVEPPTWHQLCGMEYRRLKNSLFASVGVTFLVMVLRHFGIFETSELKVYDQLMQQRPNEDIDSRLLVVEATEEDLNRYGFPLPDGILAKVVEKLEKNQPKVIGLDIYRHQPIGYGHQDLANQFKKNKHLVAVCSMKEDKNPNKGFSPPSDIPKERLGFTDVVTDRDEVLRRHLVTATPNPSDPCATQESLSFKLASSYLETLSPSIEPQEIANDGNKMKLGKATFQHLESNVGAYKKLDNGGFQVLLNYRKNVAQRVTIKEVLEDKIKPDLVKDRIILIGVTGPKSGDVIFSTPYSRERSPGVLIQAQMVSQIISAALDNRPLISTWQDWGEVLWVWGWSLVGGLIAWRCGRIMYLIIFTGTATSILYGSCLVLLIQGIWAPLLPSVLVLIVTVGLCRLLPNNFIKVAE
jgi:CHASE2 domain-containing sensor protein